MDLIFLGTSAATPTKDRNLPATALRLDNGEIILFDAGEDVQCWFEAKLKMNVPTTICISHMHGDHVIGLPGLLFNFHLGDRTAPLTIIGPPNLQPFLSMHFKLLGLRIPYPCTLIEVIPPLILEDLQEISTLRYRKYQDFPNNPEQYVVYEAVEGEVLTNHNFSLRVMWVSSYGFHIRLSFPRSGKRWKI